MKIQGQTQQDVYTRAIALPRPGGADLVLRIAPLSLGFHSRLMERGITPPVPPQRVARDSRGRPIKDAEGMAVLTKEEVDPGYREAFHRYQQELAALMIYEGLRHDEAVHFDAIPPDGGEWTTFARELCNEFDVAGWSLGDLTRVCEEICRLSNLLDDHLQVAEQGFSSPAPTVKSATP